MGLGRFLIVDEIFWMICILMFGGWVFGGLGLGVAIGFLVVGGVLMMVVGGWFGWVFGGFRTGLV